MKTNKRIIISSGCNKSHLIAIAGALTKANLYDTYLISSFYPKSLLRRFLKIFSYFSRAIYRFIDREEGIKESKIYSILLTEFISKFALIFKNKFHENIQFSVENFGIKNYAKSSINVLKKVKPKIYHYRCCYGLDSLYYAIDKKIITICDHTICHPRFIWTQLNLKNSNNNPFNSKKLSDKQATFMNSHFKLMEHDLNIARNILVDCELVKKTCVFYGLDANKIEVLYRGCDQKFLNYSNSFKKSRKKRNNLLFVGSWIKRKGVVELTKALLALKQDITLTIVGASIDDVKSITPYIFNSNIKLNVLGYLNRDKLAEVFSEHQIFIMPSLAEGSARVGFEALACGCFIITTFFSGTVVKDHENGYLVEAGDVVQLRDAILKAFELSQKEIDLIMYNNFLLIRKEFTPEKYIQKLHNYYFRLESLNKF